MPGGVPKLMKQLGALIDLGRQKPSTGATPARWSSPAPEEVPGQDANPLPRQSDSSPEGAMAVLARQSGARAAPSSKHSAASPKLLQHTGRAVVFRPRWRDMTLAGSTIPISTSNMPTTCWCCAMPARRAPPGMPEAGYLPIPMEAGAIRRQGTWCGFPMARMSGNRLRHHRAAYPRRKSGRRPVRWRW